MVGEGRGLWVCLRLGAWPGVECWDAQRGICGMSAAFAFEKGGGGSAGGRMDVRVLLCVCVCVPGMRSWLDG